MKDFHLAIVVTACIILFVFGLENFSKEIQKIAGANFRKFLGKATNFPLTGFAIGALVTTLIQSSSATSVIAISLVNAGVLSFKNSVCIIFGSNVGTTITAQLIAFNLTSFAPIFIILGFLLSMIRSRYSIFGKSLFYFGFVFFTLNLISSNLEPLKQDPRLIHFLTQSHNPLIGIAIGFVATAIVQSSSVITGLAVIFTQQQLMSPEMAIPILLGANIGTTVKSLIAVINMDISAKKTALAHFFFNLGGVLIFVPVLFLWPRSYQFLSDDPTLALANFHFVFNIATSILFIILLKPFVRSIDRMLGRGKMDFVRLNLDFSKEDMDPLQLEKVLAKRLRDLFFFVRENYNLVTLSIESHHRTIYDTARKRMEYVDFVETELLDFFSSILAKMPEQGQNSNIFKIMRRYEYIFQIHGSLKDLIKIKKKMNKRYIEMQEDLIVIVRELSAETLIFFNKVSTAIVREKEEDSIKKQARILQERIDSFNAEILKIIRQPGRKDAEIILRLMSYSRRLQDKLVNYYKLFS